MLNLQFIQDKTQREQTHETPLEHLIVSTLPCVVITLRFLRHWACAAAFHAEMLVHLAALEGKQESLAAKAALQQYREDLMQIIPAYR